MKTTLSTYDPQRFWRTSGWNYRLAGKPISDCPIAFSCIERDWWLEGHALAERHLRDTSGDS